MAGDIIFDEQPWRTQPENTEDNPEVLGPFTKVVAGPYRNAAFETEDVYGSEQTSNLDWGVCFVTVNKAYVIYGYELRHRNGDAITREAVRGAACANITNGVVGDFAPVAALDDLLNNIASEDFFIPHGARKHVEGYITFANLQGWQLLNIPVGGDGSLNPAAYSLEGFVYDGYSDRLEKGSNIIRHYGNRYENYIFDTSYGETVRVCFHDENANDSWMWEFYDVGYFVDFAWEGVQGVGGWQQSFNVLPFVSTANRLYCIVDSAFNEQRELPGGDYEYVPHRHVYQFSSDGWDFVDSHGPLLTNTTEAEVEEDRVLDTFVTSNRIYCVLGSTITGGVPRINLMWAPFAGGKDAYFAGKESIIGGTERNIALSWSMAVGGLTQVTSIYELTSFDLSCTALVTDRIKEKQGYCDYDLPFIFPIFNRFTFSVRNKAGHRRSTLDTQISYSPGKVREGITESIVDDPETGIEHERRRNLGGEETENERLEVPASEIPGSDDEQGWEEFGAKWGGRIARIIRGSIYYEGPKKSFIVELLDGEFDLDGNYHLPPIAVQGEAHVTGKHKLDVNYDLLPITVEGAGRSVSEYKLDGSYHLPPFVVEGAGDVRGRHKLEGKYDLPPFVVEGSGDVTGKLKLDVNYDMPLLVAVEGDGHVLHKLKLDANYDLPPIVVEGNGRVILTRPRCEGHGVYLWPFPPLVSGWARVDCDMILRFRRKEVL